MRLIDADKLINAIELLKIEFYQYEESPILDTVISIINTDENCGAKMEEE